MREIILPMSDDEFKDYLSRIEKKVKSWERRRTWLHICNVSVGKRSFF